MRFSPSPDATNYLDMASAVVRGDWGASVNGMWSPLYAWLLAPFLAFLSPGSYWESTLLQGINFAGLFASLLSFEFFFRRFIRLGEAEVKTNVGEALSVFSRWAMGYAVFASTALFVQSATTTDPDVWVSVFTYVIMGLLLEIRQGIRPALSFSLLGVVQGLAYLTKAFYFPMSVVILLVAWFAFRDSTKRFRYVAAASMAFCIVAGPQVVALSRVKHRLTFSDVGKLNYVFFIDQIPRPAFWRGENGSGTPVHPARILLDRPLLYEFATPVNGSYPPGFDWSYWMEGARPRFSLRGQLKVLRHSVGTFFQIFFQTQTEIVMAAMFLLFILAGSQRTRSELSSYAYILIPSVLGCLAYGLIHVEPRYVAPFVGPLWIAILFGLLVASQELPRRIATALSIAVLLMTGVRVAQAMTSDLLSALLDKQENVAWEVAQGLQDAGLHPGERVAVIGGAGGAYWAHLAGVTVVAEIPYGEQGVFWNADSETQRKVLQLFASSGARMVVSWDAPTSAATSGWNQVGSTHSYVSRGALPTD